MAAVASSSCISERQSPDRLYSFLCAHSDYFNCPINLTDYVGSELRFGERYPASLRGAEPDKAG